jgi:hypothetical protein
LVPFWANLLAPNSISVDEAYKLNPELQMEQGGTFIGVSTKCNISGIYPVMSISDSTTID